MGPIERLPEGCEVTYGASDTEIGPFATNGMAQAWVKLPSDFNGDTITLKGCRTKDGTYTLLTGDDFTWAGVTGWNLIPPPALVFPFLKVVTNTGAAAAGALEWAAKS